MALIDDIKRDAELVRDETAVGGNTAERVGGCLSNIGEVLGKVDEDTSVLMDKVFPVVVALAGGKSQDGTGNVTITATVKVDDVLTDADTIKATKTAKDYNGNVVTDAQTITFTKTSNGTYSYTDDAVKYGRNTYNLKAGVTGKTAKDADPIDVFATYPVYVWLSASAVTTIPTTKKTLTGKARVSQCGMTSDYAASSSALYYYIAAPVGWNVSGLSVKDVMGSNSFTMQKVTDTAVTDDSGNSYNIFRSSAASWKTTKSMVFTPSGSEKY